MHRTTDEGGRPVAAGMTLVELMIVIAMVAIIASLAWPTFTDQLRSGRRLDAMTGLYRLQLDQERFHARHHHYAATFAELGWDTENDDSAQSPDGYYLIHLDEAGATGFRARAQPRPGSGQSDDVCTCFVIDESGPNESESIPGCWRH